MALCSRHLSLVHRCLAGCLRVGTVTALYKVYVLYTIYDDRSKIRVSGKPKLIKTKTIVRKSSVQDRVRIDMTFNPFFVVTQGEVHLRFVLSLLTLLQLLIQLIDRLEHGYHSLDTSIYIVLVTCAFSLLSTSVVAGQ